MTRTNAFTEVRLTARFEKSFRKLSGQVQEQCEQALQQLVQDPLSKGLRMKPIRPNDVYYEVRINAGDRLVIWTVSNCAYIMDVVTHDEIARWGSVPAPTA